MSVLGRKRQVFTQCTRVSLKELCAKAKGQRRRDLADVHDCLRVSSQVGTGGVTPPLQACSPQLLARLISIFQGTCRTPGGLAPERAARFRRQERRRDGRGHPAPTSLPPTVFGQTHLLFSRGLVALSAASHPKGRPDFAGKSAAETSEVCCALVQERCPALWRPSCLRSSQRCTSATICKCRAPSHASVQVPLLRSIGPSVPVGYYQFTPRYTALPGTASTPVKGHVARRPGPCCAAADGAQGTAGEGGGGSAMLLNITRISPSGRIPVR